LFYAFVKKINISLQLERKKKKTNEKYAKMQQK